MATRILVVLTIALYAGAAARSLSNRQSRSVAASDEFYVLANKNELLRVDVGLSSAAQKLQSIDEGVVAIDYDAKSEQLFFCNNRTNKIYKTGIQTGDAVGVIVEKNSSLTYRKNMELQAIAVDWVAKKLYWINDKEGRLVRCDFDGTNDVQIKLHNDLKKVESMVVVPGNTTVVYLAREKAVGKVEITESNGQVSSSLTPSLKGFNDGPAGLAIDHATERLYWFDSKDKNSINSFKPTDQSIKTDAFSGVGSPVAIAVRQSIVVWVDEGINAYIRTVNTTQASTKSTKHSSVTKLGTGISAMAAYSKVTQQVSSDASTAPPLATTASTTSRSPTNQPVATQKATADSATTTSGPKSDGATSALLPVSTQKMPTTAKISTKGMSTTSMATTSSRLTSKLTSKVSNKPTAQSSQTGTPRLPASKRTTDDGQSTSKVSNKPTDRSSQTETPRLVSGGTKAAPEPEISKGVSSPTTNAVGKPTDGDAGEGNPAEPASSQVFTCECQNAGSCVEVEGQKSVCECREGYEGDLCEICSENSLGCEPTDSIADGQEQSAANDEVNAAGKTSPLSMYVGVGVAVPVLIAVVVVLVVVLRRRSKKVSGKTTTDSANVWANPTYDEVNAGGTAKTSPLYDVSILSTVTPQVPAFDDQVYEEIPADKINGVAENLDDYQEADDFYRGDGQTAGENYESPTSVCATKPPSENVEERKVENDYYLSPAASVGAQTRAEGDDVYDNGRDLLASTESRTDDDINVTVRDRPLPDEPVYDN